MLLDSLDVTPDAFAAGTGWAIKPQGACKAEVCVPLPRTEAFDLRATAERLGMAVIHDEASGLWALGPEALGTALVSAQAPELVLDDLAGRPFRMSALRGQKVVLVAWAPY